MITLGAIANIVSDLAIMALPLAMLYGLHMSQTQKLGLAAVFSLAFVDIACTAVRLAAWWSNGPYPYYSLIECPVAVLTCNLPVYRHLLRKRNHKQTPTHARAWLSCAKRRAPQGSLSDERYIHIVDVEPGELAPPARAYATQTTSCSSSSTYVFHGTTRLPSEP